MKIRKESLYHNTKERAFIPGALYANAHINVGSNSYEKVKTFKYLGSLLTNQNSIQEEIKFRLRGGKFKLN